MHVVVRPVIRVYTANFCFISHSFIFYFFFAGNVYDINRPLLHQLPDLDQIVEEYCLQVWIYMFSLLAIKKENVTVTSCPFYA